MKRRELELAIRAAGRIARDSEFLRLGSQAVHAHCQLPPAEVLLSQECDLYPRNRPETANLLDGELGRGSAFARRHGFSSALPDAGDINPVHTSGALAPAHRSS